MNWIEKLNAPFEMDELEWRPGPTGVYNDKIWIKPLAYVQNRAIMNRLDDTIGPAFWQNEIKHCGSGGKTDGFLCGISIDMHMLHDIDNEAEWITKWDGAPCTDIEPFKGGISDSMKRAAVQWGMGRYLYRLKNLYADVVKTRPPGNSNYRYAKVKGQNVYWCPPELPDFAKPRIVNPPKKVDH